MASFVAVDGSPTVVDRLHWRFGTAAAPIDPCDGFITCKM